MGIKLYREPRIENPVLVASWPGIGNIGIIAVDALRQIFEAEEFAEIEPWHFFYPKRVLIRNGVLESMEFPTSKFYISRVGSKDLILFIGEEQPGEGVRAYAAGKKAYRMANLVLDVAERFRCERIYTSGAAVALTHHTMKPRVWAVPNTERLLQEVGEYQNAILMSDIEGRGGQGNITGLNGLLLGVARKRGVDAVCLMGETPVYLQGLPVSYPKASKSVLGVLGQCLGIQVSLHGLDEMEREVERAVEEFYRQLPSEMREQLDRLKPAPYAEPGDLGPITEDEERRIMEDVERFFKEGGQGD